MNVHNYNSLQYSSGLCRLGYCWTVWQSFAMIVVEENVFTLMKLNF